MSEYVIAITRADGGRVLLKPGGHAERDLIASVTDAVIGRGVGLFRTEAQVRAAIAQGFDEVLHAMKAEVLP